MKFLIHERRSIKKMKKVIWLTTIFTLVISLAIPILVTAQNQSTWIKFFCYIPRYCPYSAYCTGEYATGPSMCEVQCWYTEKDIYGWLIPRKCGSANCGGNGGGWDEWDDGGFWEWWFFCI
jgi:hypothetical protein